MSRTRFQEGSLAVQGNGKTARYVTRFRVYAADSTFVQKKVVIGFVSEMSKREATKQKALIVAKQTSQLPQAVSEAKKGETTFKSFYEDRFLVMKSDWGEPHRESFTYIMDSFVLPKFGDIAIADIDKVMVQSRLNSLTPKYSASTIKHVRTKMVEVFEEAVEQEFINRNPASKTKIPSTARKAHQPILTEEQLITIIDKLTDARDKAIFLIGTFCAMRTSEVFGLPWKNFHESTEEGQSYFLVDQIAYRGQRYERTKTDSSEAPVPIGGRTLKALLEWRRECKDTSPDALIFPSTNLNGRSRKGAPMYPATWLQKKLQPVATAVGVPFKVNFRATRRTASSLVQGHGAALATAQSLLRHASPTTTALVYTKVIPESVKVAVNDYEERVFAARPKPPKLRRVK
jgi:integrase